MTELLQTLQGGFITLAAFIFALGVIIAVHEWGHLVVAKLFDVRVHAFSLGFGPRLWGFQRGETEYKVSAIPLGGYVKLGGEQPDEVTEDPRDFLNKPRWQRILVYLAGPAMNVLLALVLIAGVFMVGIEMPNLSAVPPVVGFVEPGSSAAEQGLEPGDRIVAVEGDEVESWDDVNFRLATTMDRTLELRVERAGETFPVTVTPRRVEEADLSDRAGLWPSMLVLPTLAQVNEGGAAAAAGLQPGDRIRRAADVPMYTTEGFVEVVSAHPAEEILLEVLRGDRILEIPVTPEDRDGSGVIGVAVEQRLVEGAVQRYGFFQAFVQSAHYNWDLTEKTFAILGRIFTREVSARDNLAGPIQIAAITGQAAKRGPEWLIHLMGMISISIAILNLLPIPILDGGQIVILLVESTMRRDLSFKVKELVSQVGFVLIILLMLTVIYFDLSKTLPGLIPGG